MLAYLIKGHLSEADINNACDQVKYYKQSTSDEFLDRFRIYCLIKEDRIEEAQLQYDLLKEKGFKDNFYDEKINFLLGYTEDVRENIDDNNILNFHLSHVVNKDFQYDPSAETSKHIWKYLSASNLLLDSESIDLEDEEKFLFYEKAAAEDLYSRKELFKVYGKFLFSFDQFLNAEETYKMLPKYKARA